MGNANYRTPLRTNRDLLMYILLNLVTCGIYSIYSMTTIGIDVNTIASRYDGRKTMNYCLMFFVISYITCGIGPIVWFHNISDRIGNELRRRNIFYSFGASDFWLWYILGSFIIVGPFIYIYKLMNAMNLICGDYNVKG